MGSSHSKSNGVRHQEESPEMIDGPTDDDATASRLAHVFVERHCEFHPFSSVSYDVFHHILQKFLHRSLSDTQSELMEATTQETLAILEKCGCEFTGREEAFNYVYVNTPETMGKMRFLNVVGVRVSAVDLYTTELRTKRFVCQKTGENLHVQE